MHALPGETLTVMESRSSCPPLHICSIGKHYLSSLVAAAQFIVLRLMATNMLDDGVTSAVEVLDLVFQVRLCSKCCSEHGLPAGR